MIQKINKILALGFALGSILSLAIGVAFTITTGSPAFFIGGLALFLAFAGFAATIDSTI